MPGRTAPVRSRTGAGNRQLLLLSGSRSCSSGRRAWAVPASAGSASAGRASACSASAARTASCSSSRVLRSSQPWEHSRTEPSVHRPEHKERHSSWLSEHKPGHREHSSSWPSEHRLEHTELHRRQPSAHKPEHMGPHTMRLSVHSTTEHIWLSAHSTTDRSHQNQTDQPELS